MDIISFRYLQKKSFYFQKKTSENLKKSIDKIRKPDYNIEKFRNPDVKGSKNQNLRRYQNE